MKQTLILLLLLLPAIGIADASPPNWGGSYAPCKHHSDLLARDHVNLGVRISTANSALGQQFARAMDFWALVLDVEWHEVDSQDCAVQLVDGTPSLFDFCICMSARSQLPDRDAFQGWVAFNSRLKLTKHEMFLDSVHEIGHLLGLPHNPDDSSVMFAFELDKDATLDAADLETLSARHHLRFPISCQKGCVKDVRVVVPGQSGALGQH